MSVENTAKSSTRGKKISRSLINGAEDRDQNEKEYDDISSSISQLRDKAQAATYGSDHELLLQSEEVITNVEKMNNAYNYKKKNIGATFKHDTKTFEEEGIDRNGIQDEKHKEFTAENAFHKRQSDDYDFSLVAIEDENQGLIPKPSNTKRLEVLLAENQNLKNVILDLQDEVEESIKRYFDLNEKFRMEDNSLRQQIKVLEEYKVSSKQYIESQIKKVEDLAFENGVLKRRVEEFGKRMDETRHNLEERNGLLINELALMEEERTTLRKKYQELYTENEFWKAQLDEYTVKLISMEEERQELLQLSRSNEDKIDALLAENEILKQETHCPIKKLNEDWQQCFCLSRQGNYIENNELGLMEEERRILRQKYEELYTANVFFKAQLDDYNVILISMEEERQEVLKLSRSNKERIEALVGENEILKQETQVLVKKFSEDSKQYLYLAQQANVIENSLRKQIDLLQKHIDTTHSSLEMEIEKVRRINAENAGFDAKMDEMSTHFGSRIEVVTQLTAQNNALRKKIEEMSTCLENLRGAKAIAVYEKEVVMKACESLIAKSKHKFKMLKVNAFHRKKIEDLNRMFPFPIRIVALAQPI